MQLLIVTLVSHRIAFCSEKARMVYLHDVVIVVQCLHGNLRATVRGNDDNSKTNAGGRSTLSDNITNLSDATGKYR